MVSGIVTAPFTARALGVEGRAVVVVVTTVSVGLLILGTFGLGWITRQELSRGMSSARDWKQRALTVDATSFLPSIAAGAALAWVLGVGGHVVAPLIVVISLSMLSALRAVWANMLIASGRAWGYGVANLSATTFVVFATVGAYVLQLLTLASALWIQAGGLAIQTSLVALLAERIPHARGIGRASRGWLRAWFPRIRKSVGGQIVDFVVGRSDLIVVALVGTSFQLGLYSVPGLIPVVVYQITVTVIQHSWAPGVAKDTAARIGISWRVSVLVGTFASIVGGLGVWLVFLPLFGEQFEGSVDYIVPACAMAAGIAAIVPAVQHAATSDGGSLVVWSTLGAVLVNALVARGLGWHVADAVVVLAVTLVLVGATYTARSAGVGALLPRPRELIRFVRG